MHLTNKEKVKKKNKRKQKIKPTLEGIERQTRGLLWKGISTQKKTMNPEECPIFRKTEEILLREQSLWYFWNVEPEDKLDNYSLWKMREESQKGESPRGNPQILCKNFVQILAES